MVQFQHHQIWQVKHFMVWACDSNWTQDGNLNFPFDQQRLHRAQRACVVNWQCLYIPNRLMAHINVKYLHWSLIIMISCFTHFPLLIYIWYIQHRSSDIIYMNIFHIPMQTFTVNFSDKSHLGCTTLSDISG